MRRALVAAVAVAVAPALVGISLLLLAHPWTADVAYALPGFPEPRIPLSDEERSRLAGVSTRAIQPWRPDGMEDMREARLETGGLAFSVEELQHFEDVRDVVAGFLIAGAAALVLVAAAFAFDRGAVARGLAMGAKGTLGVLAVLALVMLVGFETFFEAFHGIFFEGDSWRLADLGVVRSLYPDAFWGLMGGTMAALITAQAVATLLVLRRRSSPR